MKAVVLHEYGGPDKLKYEDVADPVAGEGELLVRVAATSVNPIDYKMRSGAALRVLAEDVAAKRLTIPIDRMIPLEDAAAGQAAAEKGGIGKVLLLT